MRRFLLGLLWITACYAPSVRTDVPCAPMTDACPDGQSCVSGHCVVAGTLAMPDAMVSGIVDRDDDKIADDRDNCPDVANTDQANEDGDATGDACDLCPQIADNGADADGDHIGDACDPNPTSRDTRWLFSGFGAGLPAWSRTTNWTATNGMLIATSAGNTTTDSEYIVAPFTATGSPDNFAVAITVTATSLMGSNGDHSVGIEIWDQSVMKGVDCVLDQGPGGTNSVLQLRDDNTNGLRKSTPLSWTTGTSYRLWFARHGAGYSCTAITPTGTTNLTGNSNIVPRDGNAVDFWAYGATAQFGSVEIVGTP